MKKLLYVGEFKGDKVPKKKQPTEWISVEHTKIENLEHLLRTQIEPTKRILIFQSLKEMFHSLETLSKKWGGPIYTH